MINLPEIEIITELLFLNTDQGTPLPIGTLLDPYGRVLRLSAEMENSVCQRFETEQVACPPSLGGKVFTTAAVDIIDHSPSSPNAKDSFHGTGISSVQHTKAGHDCGIVVIEVDSAPQTTSHQPHYILMYLQWNQASKAHQFQLHTSSLSEG